MATWYEFSEFGVSFYETAPFRIVAKTEINASADTVFEALKDESRWSVWLPAIQHVEWTSPKPIRVGSTRRISTRHGRKIEEQCIRWIPERRASFRVVRSSMSRLLRAGTDFELTPTDTGCDVRWTIAIQPRGFLAQVGYVVRPAARVAVRVMLRRFKKMVENPS